jgi:formate/nitrite transporter FocA (FNT family)
MGFSFIAEAPLCAHLPDRPWRPVICKLGYCVGFLVVDLGRQQLFTENTLTVILTLLLRRSRRLLLRSTTMGRGALDESLGNISIRVFCRTCGLLPSRSPSNAGGIGAAHTGVTFGIVFVRAILAGWIIALMVWLLPGAEPSRVAIIVILTYLVGLGTSTNSRRANHAILFDFYTRFPGVLISCTFLFPTLLANVIGGVSLVAALGHAQVLGRP